MAQIGVRLDQGLYSCSICLDALKDPVTLSCGHSYCKNCIDSHWDGKKIYSCPQCRQMFKPKPVLVKNTMLANLVEELKKTGLQAALGDQRYAAAERAERQREYEVSRPNLQQRIQGREEDVKLLQGEVDAINRSADKTVEDSEKIFTDLIRLLEKGRRDVSQQVRSQQQTEVSRVRELQEKLQQEITELQRKDAEMKKLSLSEDYNQVLYSGIKLSGLSEPKDSSSIDVRPLRYFEDVTAAVTELRNKLQGILSETWTNVSLTATNVGQHLAQSAECAPQIPRLRSSNVGCAEPDSTRSPLPHASHTVSLARVSRHLFGSPCRVVDKMAKK